MFALNHLHKELCDPNSFDLLLEVLPHLLEMLQQRIGYHGFGKDVVPSDMPDMSKPDRVYHKWNYETREYEKHPSIGSWNPLTR